MRKRVYAWVAVLVVLAASFAAPSGAQDQKKPLRLEEIFTEAGLTGRMPTQMRWSPDGKRLTYILQEDQGERHDLWVLEAETGEKRVLVSYEQLTKLAPPYEGVQDEREKERLLRYSVAAYVWSPDSKQILFTSAGWLYLYDLATQEAKPLAASKRGVGDPSFPRTASGWRLSMSTTSGWYRRPAARRSG